MHLCGGGGGAIIYAHVWCACFLCFAWQRLGLFLSVVHGSVLACVMRVAVVCLCVAQGLSVKAGAKSMRKSKSKTQKQNAKAKS